MQIWDLETANVLLTLPHSANVLGIDWRTDGKLLAAACEDSRVYVWDAESGKQRHVLEGHKSVVHQVAFHPIQNLLVSHAWDGTTRVWSLADGSPLLSVDGYFCRFDPQGQHLAFRNGVHVGLWEVASRTMCETLYACDGSQNEYCSVAIRLDGRLMASGTVRGGVRLWDLDTFKEVAVLPTGTTPSVRFHPQDGSLITSSHRGLFKWPITRCGQQHPSQLVIGPPAPMNMPAGTVPHCMDMSRDGSTIVVDDSSRDSAVVLHPAHDKIAILSSGEQRSHIATSPDGKWVARGNYAGSGVEVWDAPSGELVRTLPVNGTATVAFSPNGHWLVTAGTEYRFWSTGSWQPGLVMDGIGGGNQGGRMAFSRDGKMLAVTLHCNLVQLIEMDTGRVLADLESTPKPAWVQAIRFSSDANRLVAACGNEGLKVWDLRRIRERLAAMNLDWDMPAYSAAAQLEAPAPLQVDVELGSLAGAIHRQQSRDYASAGQWQLAVEKATEAIELSDLDAEALALRARAFRALKQYDQAIADYSQMLKLDPTDSLARSRRAYVYTLVEKWRNALADFTEFTQLKPDVPLGWSNRAYVHRQLGQLKESLSDYDEAIKLAPDQFGSWHQRGHVHEALHQWDHAISDLSKAIELKPGDSALHRCRGIVQAQRADWAAAAKDLEKAIELAPNMAVRTCYELALVKLAAANSDGHKKTCAEMLSHFRETEDPNEASFVAWTCVLSPTSVADWSAVIALAERATKLVENGSNTLCQTALGDCAVPSGSFRPGSRTVD